MPKSWLLFEAPAEVSLLVNLNNVTRITRQKNGDVFIEYVNGTSTNFNGEGASKIWDVAKAHTQRPDSQKD